MVHFCIVNRIVAMTLNSLLLIFFAGLILVFAFGIGIGLFIRKNRE